MLTSRVWLKVAVTLIAVIAAPAIARSRLILVPKELLDNPAALAKYRGVIALVLRIAATTVLIGSLVYQRVVLMSR